MDDTAVDRPVRRPHLEVTEVSDGLVVYQDAPERVHHLNSTATYVFELSDGDHTVEEIAEAIRIAFALDDAPSDAVVACVATLRDKGLLR